MIKVKINKSLAEGGNVFAGKTDSIPLEFIQPTLDKYYEELDRLFPEHSDKFKLSASWISWKEGTLW